MEKAKWIEWHGGGFVPEGMVDIQLRGGRVERNQDPRAVMWQHRYPIATEDQVVAYRRAEEE